MGEQPARLRVTPASRMRPGNTRQPLDGAPWRAASHNAVAVVGPRWAGSVGRGRLATDRHEALHAHSAGAGLQGAVGW